MYWDNVTQVTGSDFTTSSTSLVDITGLTFAALANSKYEVEAVLAFQSSSAAGVKFSVAYSAALATGQFVTLGSAATGTAGSGSNALGVAETFVYGTTANTTMTCWIKMILVTGSNAGNITIQGLKVTSGTLTVYIGSVMKIKKLS